MALTKNAQSIYNELINNISTKKVITYSCLSNNTGVPLGIGGGAVKEALAELFIKCDIHQLPPITSIVVQKNNQYDPLLKHGMPGGGYLTAEAFSENNANRPRENGWEVWSQKPRPNDTEVWRFKNMIEAHQNLVWNYSSTWPTTL